MHEDRKTGEPTLSSLSFFPASSPSAVVGGCRFVGWLVAKDDNVNPMDGNPLGRGTIMSTLSLLLPSGSLFVL